jgi:O-acetyl-ADP-ribose deacetylase (regulator of RNase III)
MPFLLVKGDITKLEVDVVVNAASTSLGMGGGVCGAIFRAAGVSLMQQACAPLAPIASGDAVITPGFALPCKAVIHTAGPIYRDGKHQEREILTRCYRNSLRLALQEGFASIAFPLISSGIYGYPKQEALEVASSAITCFLEHEEMLVYLVLFDRASLVANAAHLDSLKHYLDHGQQEVSEEVLFSVRCEEPYPELEKQLGEQAKSFDEMVLGLIRAEWKTEVEVYKKANLDRRLFSKIRSGNGYIPSKRTILALAFGLELSRDATEELLACAGYDLSPSTTFDRIISFFLSKEVYDVFAINEVLFSYDQPLLGS